jgi:hypothetical protein
MKEYLDILKDLIPVGSDAYLKIKRADEENKLILEEKNAEIKAKQNTIYLLYAIIAILFIYLLFKK